MNNFINYHQHSFASFLDGIAKPDDIAKRCKELGMTHAMVTDHGNVAGHIQFIKACRKVGIEPIVGTELYVKDDRYDNGRPKGYHLLLWALNTEGMHNIWSISSNTYYATSQDHRTPNTRWEHMEGHGSGVVCSSACMGGMLSEAAKNNDYDEADYLVEKCKAIFDEFAVEIHTNDEEGQHKVNLWLMKYAKSRGLRVVYSVDSHYVWPEDAEFHDVWLGMATRSHYDEDHWRMKHQYYIHSEQEVRDALAYLGEEDVQRCFDGVGELLAKVEPVALDNSHKVAKADIPEGFKDSNQYFLYLVAKNLFEKVGGVRTWPVEGKPGEFKAETVPDENLPALTEALHVLQDKELPIIIDNGLADYFLMVSDYAYWAKKHMLVGPGRGSAAASLVCYLLNITSINPMGQGLVFERFLNQGRLGTYAVSFEDADDIEYGEHVTVRTDGGDVPVSTVKEGATVYGRLDYRGEFEPYDRALKVRKIIFHGGELPDIDLDFEGRKRWMLERHLVEKYGEDKVTAVGTTLYYKMSLALQDVCRYYRIPHPDTLKLTAVVGRLEEAATGNETWRDRLMVTDPADRAMVEGYERDYPDLFRYAERMVGLPRQQGKHAAGYVISPVSLTSELPVRKAFPSKTEEDVIGQFDKYETEDLGFVKADILGLRNLDTLALMADMVEERTGERIDWYGLEDDPDDMAIWSLFDEGRTLGLFQCESKGVTGVAQALKPRSIKDLSVIIALYRPGVIDAGMLDEYLDRATGEKPVEYLHPSLEPILKDTLGIVVMQEEGMLIFRELGGFTDREADELRAAIGHKDAEALKSMKPKFIEGCVQRGIPTDTANKIFEQVEASGRYSFNCLTGDTMLRRANACYRDKAYPGFDIPVEEVYRRWHDTTPTARKYRNPNRGLWIMAYDEDGRARKARIKNIVKNGICPVYRLVTESGKEVRATGNHRFLTTDGYCTVEKISVGDMLVCCDFEYEKTDPSVYSRITDGERRGVSDKGRKGFGDGAANCGYIDGGYAAFEAFKRSMKDKPCSVCGKTDGRFEAHHIDCDRTNNDESNLQWLCVSCHKKAHYDMGRTCHGQKGYPTTVERVVSVEPAGAEDVYDIEMDSEGHNFFANGICSHNSGHSISYGTVTFWTAWAKAHHPVEYLAASMSTVGDKKAPEYMAEARHRGIRISPPSVLKPTRDYTILSDDEMAFGLVNVKGVGDKAIAKIVDGAPYRDFCDFVERSGANSKVIKTLVDGSFFREWEPNARKLKLMYEEGTYRPNLFGDALVSEAVPYPVERVAEIETGIYGMPLTVDPFQPYRERLGTTICDLITRDFDSLPVRGQAVALARVTEVRGRTDRKGNPMAFLTLVTDDDVTVEATCFGSMWGPIRKDVHEGTIALFGLTKDLYNGRTSWQVSNIKRFHREGD